MANDFDVIFVGGGPAAYPGAIRAAQLGMRVACIERRPRLGGTCLNVGCIPSKALLESSERFILAKHEYAKHGVIIPEVSVDLPTMLGHKDRVVADLGRGIDALFRKHKVERLVGHGRFVDRSTVAIMEQSAERTLTSGAIVIATGSDIVSLPGIVLDEQRIVSSTGALSLTRIPERMVVIGGGYIGLEMGSVWQRLGADVTVIEYLDRLAPGIDGEMAQQLRKVLEKAGFHFRFQTKVTGARVVGEKVQVSVEPAAGGESEQLEVDVVLVAVGRRPFTEGLGLEMLGVATDKKGFVTVDKEFRTNVPGVYAIGDVIGGPMLAHKASEEGVTLMELLAGQKPRINYGVIPSIIYTSPEVAAVGATEEALKASAVEYRVGKFPFSANSRARAKGETTGLVKILADVRTDEVLGVHIIGPEAGTMIHEASVAMEFKAAAEDLARCVHAHPTLPEAIKEAALAVAGRTLNI